MSKIMLHHGLVDISETNSNTWKQNFAFSPSFAVIVIWLLCLDFEHHSKKIFKVP